MEESGHQRKSAEATKTLIKDPEVTRSSVLLTGSSGSLGMDFVKRIEVPEVLSKGENPLTYI